MQDTFFPLAPLPQAKYILDAVLFVADHGASFLPYYRVNYKTGEWKHKTRFTRFPERRYFLVLVLVLLLLLLLSYSVLLPLQS